MDDETRIADPVNAEEVNESLGMGGDSQSPAEEAPKDDLPLAAKERLGRQEKRHKKEMRALQAQIMDLQNRVPSQQPQQTSDFQQQQPPMNPYTQQPIQPGSVEEQIHRAVSMALQAKEQQERQAQQAQQAMEVHQELQKFNQRLDSASDKYDDFDEAVRSDDAKFTPAMRDAAMLLPNAEDVLYKLGKNRDELDRISKLHPLQQQKELLSLGYALHSGEMGRGNQTSQPKVMGEIKGTPVSSNAIDGKTPVSVLRQKLKSGWR